MSKLQSKFDKRLYTTTLDFAHDLCEIINVGINTEPKSEFDNQPRFELVESPTKPPAKVLDRKRLGKRILGTVKPQLETALKSEADITSKSYAILRTELEGMMDASLEVRKIPLSKPEAESSGQGESSSQKEQDVIMADTSEDAHIIVVEVQSDGAAGGDGDRMDVDELSIEVRDEDATETKGKAPANPDDGASFKAHEEHLPNGIQSAPTPPNTNGYISVSHASTGPTPLTPPQSNGSLGRGTDNMLTEGGVPWYLKAFEPVGTTATEEQWSGRDVLRSMSEELTDMDEAELNDLEFNVEDSTITASPVNTLPGDDQHLALPAGGLRSGGTRRKVGGAVAGVNKKRLRSSAKSKRR